MEKRDRAQKMKRDKRSKDAKRGRDNTNKSENKCSNVAASNSQGNSTQDQKSDAAKLALNKETVEEAQEVSQIDFSNLKRETDEINQLNKTYSKRQISSNWAKYETPFQHEDDEVMSKGADFESLLGAPISEGGHFKFKSEQMWSQSPLQFSDIFSLDVKHLARSLSRVPFYEQVSLSKELFSEEELEIMDTEAAQNSDRFKNALEEPVINNLYEVLKSSLADTVMQKSTGNKLDIKPEIVVKEPKENMTVFVSFVEKQVDDAQPEQSIQLDISLDISSESQESKDIANNVQLQMVLAPISTESKLGDLIDNQDRPMPKQEEVPLKRNDTSKKVEVSASTSKELTPTTSDLTLKQNSSPVEDDDELDFLLTLKHPISGPKFAAKLPSKTVAADDILSDNLGALSLSNTTEAKEDLEDWLDSMLAD